MKTKYTPEAITVKNNRLIAEFMGYKIIPYNGDPNKLIYNGNNHTRTIGDEKKLWNGLDLNFTGRFVEFVKHPFETDFNYLLPIIRKIEELNYVVCIAGIKYQIYRVLEEQYPIISLVCGDLNKKTQMVYSLVIDFIEWYNLNGKEKANV